MKKFSVVITTRQRKQLLSNLLKSIKNKTKNLNDIEVHVNYDLDDSETIEFLNKEYGKEHCATEFHGRLRSQWMHRDYINWCVLNFCKGKYVLSLNDDTEFATQNWDEIAFNELEEYLKDKPDGIVYGSIDDSLLAQNKVEDRQYCCFPIISMKAIEALGFMFDNEFQAWNADIAIYYVYKDINRIKCIPQMRIEHLCHHNGKRQRDVVNIGVEKLSVDRSSPTSFVERDVQILKKAIIY